MENKGKIFVIYHKPENPIFSDVYQPLAVGCKDHNDDKFLYDNIGENISEKNRVYNEITGIFWVFSHLKEFKDIQYVGFSHYRRLFCFKGDKTSYVKKNIDESLVSISQQELKEIFSQYDFIVPRPNKYKSVRKHYEKSHNKEDINLLLKCIQELEPDYLDSAKEYLEGSNEYLYNMFVFKKEDFINYGNFIFPILDKFVFLKPNIDRLYISERLTGIFIYHLIQEGSVPLHLPILHIRNKSVGLACKQIRNNKEANKHSSAFYKYKPLLICLVPRFIEQSLRRRKAK